jgi:hypothetical protein
MFLCQPVLNLEPANMCTLPTHGIYILRALDPTVTRDPEECYVVPFGQDTDLPVYVSRPALTLFLMP